MQNGSKITVKMPQLNGNIEKIYFLPSHTHTHCTAKLPHCVLAVTILAIKKTVWRFVVILSQNIKKKNIEKKFHIF